VVPSPEAAGRLSRCGAKLEPRGLKSRAALSLAYGAGLRASEVVSLKLPDIDSSRMAIRVEQGKGGKDRYATRNIARARNLLAMPAPETEDTGTAEDTNPPAPDAGHGGTAADP